MTISGIIRYSVLALLMQCLSANASYHTTEGLTQILEPNRNIDYTLDGKASRITETIIKAGREAIREPNNPTVSLYWVVVNLMIRQGFSFQKAPLEVEL